MRFGVRIRDFLVFRLIAWLDDERLDRVLAFLEER
jgi:hypothetical protein